MILEWPKIIAVEGIDGSGKTTFIYSLCEYLNKKGYVVKVNTLKKHNSVLVKYYNERNQCCENQYMKLSAYMLDLLAYNMEIEGSCFWDFLIFDRYIDTLEAYFGSLNVHIPWVTEMKKYVYEPYLAILLDLPVEVALKRIGKRKGARKVLENYEYLSNVRDKYLQIANNKPYLIVDARLDGDTLCSLVMEKLQIEVSN